MTFIVTMVCLVFLMRYLIALALLTSRCRLMLTSRCRLVLTSRCRLMLTSRCRLM